MKNHKNLFVRMLAVTILICFGFASNAMAETMTLDDCLQKAMQDNVMLKAARQGVNVQKSKQRSVRGRFLPVVQVEGNLIAWEKEQVMSLFPAELAGVMEDPAVGTMVGLLQPDNQAILQGTLAGLTNPMVLREDITYSGSVTIAQPLTQLYQIYSGYWATGELAKKAGMDAKKAERDIQMAVTNAYYSLIMAQKMEKTAEAGLKQVEAIEKQVEAFLAAEMVERNALLKVLVQKADIQKGLFQAQKGVQLATAALNMLMHRPLDLVIEPVMDETEDSKVDDYLNMQLKKQQDKGIQNRPDFLAVKYQSKAAKAGKHAAIAAMLPELNAFFKYENNQGMGSMSLESVYYGGLTLSWNVWEWGATYYGIKEAEAQQEQAESMVMATNEQVRLDVKTKRLELEEALKNLKVAIAQVEQAQENLRVEQARFEVQETTTTDLLDAQTLSLKSENEHIVAITRVQSATIALSISMGEDLVEKK